MIRLIFFHRNDYLFDMMMKKYRKYVIMHKERKNFYARTLFIHQRHFVADVKEAKRFRYRDAQEFLRKFKHSENYKIIEVKK